MWLNLSKEEINLFIKLQKNWHVFFENELFKYISKKDFNKFLKEWLIIDIYKKKIFWLVAWEKTIKDLFNNYQEKILSMICQLEFNWNYSMWYKYSLYKYLNKTNQLKIKDIIILCNKKKKHILINWINDFKCHYKENFNNNLFIKYWKDNINLINQLELFTYLFWRKIFWNWEFDEIELSLFLSIFYYDIKDFIKRIDWNDIYNQHILKNSFKIYQKYWITNNNLFNIYKHYWFLTEKDKKQNKFNYTHKDYSWEEWDVVRMKKMIDNVINFSIEFENKSKDIINSIETFSIKEIKDNIKLHSSNDIYHSTTIEWYKINKKDVIYINEWKLPSYIWEEKKKDYEKLIKDYWIIKSYKRTLDMIIQNYLWKNKKFTKDDIVKINYYEFIELHEIRWDKLENYNYRNYRVLMHWCNWFVPVEEIWKIDTLIDYLFNEIQKIKNKLIQWIALHFLMIPIQPFWDWNWRLSRFLMNITFSNWWYQWCTIDQHNYRLLFLSSYNLINEEKYNELLEVYVNFMNFIFSYFNVDIKK